MRCRLSTPSPPKQDSHTRPFNTTDGMIFYGRKICMSSFVHPGPSLSVQVKMMIGWCVRHGEPKMAQFRTHYLTKERAYVSTQQSGYFPIDTKMILWLPNEDFGTRNKRWNEDFLSTFQWFMAQIEYSRPWKVLRKSAFHLLFILPKSSFGEHKLFRWFVAKS